MDGEIQPNPLPVHPPQNQQQRQPRDESHLWKPNQKNKKRSRKAPPGKEPSKRNLSSYMMDKGYYNNEVSIIACRCRNLVSVSEDKCPRYLRLAPVNYPHESLVKTEQVPKLRNYLMKRNGRRTPRVLDVVSVDGYALVLCNDKFTFDTVRGLLPQLDAEENMELRQPSKKEIDEYCRARRARIAVEGRDTGLKKYRAQKKARKKAERELAKAAAAASDPNNVPPPLEPNEPLPPAGVPENLPE